MSIFFNYSNPKFFDTTNGYMRMCARGGNVVDLRYFAFLKEIIECRTRNFEPQK